MSSLLCDVLVIGCGPAGYKAALKLARAGKKVIVAELGEESVGGVCLNKGCIPVKSILQAAKFYSDLKKKNYGISLSGNLSIEKVIEFYRGNVSDLRNALLAEMRRSGVEFVFGKAVFAGEKKVSVGGKIVEGKSVIIATGSRMSIPNDIFVNSEASKIGKGEFCETTDTFLDKFEIPASVAIIGAGFGGFEFASFLSDFGSKVFLLEAKNFSLSDEDPDVFRGLSREFSKKGIKIFTGIKNLIVEPDGKKVSFSSEEISVEKVIFACGRVPQTAELALEKTGVSRKNGFIDVDENYIASPGIYACGDVIDTLHLASSAFAEGEFIASHILGENPEKIFYEAVPKVIFTNPNVAFCGKPSAHLSERKIFFKANPKAFIFRENSGFVKVLFEKESGKIKYALVIAPEAAELIHIFSLAVIKGLTLRDLKKVVFAHPSFSEIISDL